MTLKHPDSKLKIIYTKIGEPSPELLKALKKINKSQDTALIKYLKMIPQWAKYLLKIIPYLLIKLFI